MYQQGSANSSHNLMVGWDNNFHTEFFPESPDYRLVEGDPALEHDWRLDVFAQPHIAEVVAHQSLAETVEDIFNPVPHLLLVHHVRFRKDGAASGDAHRGTARQRSLAEFFDAHIEAQRLVVKEAAGAGGADGIHGKVSDYTVADDGYLTILTPDFHDGPDVGEVMQGGHCVGRNLVLHQVRTNDYAGEVAGTPGCGHTADVAVCGKLFPDFPQSFLYHINRPALGQEIDVVNQLVVPIEDGKFGGYRTNINPEVGLHHHSL